VEANAAGSVACIHDLQAVGHDHGPLVQLMKAAAKRRIKKVLVASGIRMDLARRSPEYMREAATHHVGGHLKVARSIPIPRAGTDEKTGVDDFQKFDQDSPALRASRQETVFGSLFHRQPSWQLLDSMIDLAVFLKAQSLPARPGAGLYSQSLRHRGCMYHAGLDPFTKKPVYIARHLRDRKLQRALMQFFRPENYFEVRRAWSKPGGRT